MQTVAFHTQKGGTGKSTLAVHLAVCAIRRRKSVALIDLDPQASVTGWARRRANVPGLACSVPAFRARPHELAGMLKSARAQGADLVVLDTAGRADVSAGHVIAAADVVLVPCRPAAYDLEASIETAAEVKRAGRPAYFVLNAVPPRGTRHEEAREALAALLPVCPVSLGYRMAYGDALNDGRSVEELDPKGAAAAEIRALYKWVASLG